MPQIPHFDPPTYKAGDGLPEKQTGAGPKVQAPCCGLWVWFWRLADVSGFPGSCTHGVAWACDGCRRHWIRTARPMGKGKAATEAAFAKLWGAPAPVVANLEEVNRKRLARLPRLQAKHDGLAAIHAQRIAEGREPPDRPL